MPNYTLQNVLDLARTLLNDNIAISTGEQWPNNLLIPHFAGPWRTAWAAIQDTSKVAQKIAYVILPANTTVMIPWAPPYNIPDFSEPHMMQQRLPGPTYPIVATDTSTPIKVQVSSTSPFNPLSEVIVSGVSGSQAPLGLWYPTIVDGTHFSLNGSASDGNAGTGGEIITAGTQAWSPVYEADSLPDVQPQQYIANFAWINQQLMFTPSVTNMALKITYWATGVPATNPNASLGMEDAPVDFLATAMASNAARAQGLYTLSEKFFADAYGSEGKRDGSDGLLGAWIKVKSLEAQNVQHRRLAFRPKKSRFGNFYTG